MEEKNAEGTIGTRLRLVLALRGQSIREFSNAAGLPYRTFQDYLSDKAKPSAEQLTRIALAGIDIHYVLTGQLLPAIGNMQKIAIRMFGKLDLHNKNEAISEILADHILVEKLQKDAYAAVDIIIKEEIRQGRTDLHLEGLLGIYMEALFMYFYTAMSMGVLIADLRKHRHPVEQIIELIRSGASARLSALMGELGASERPGNLG